MVDDAFGHWLAGFIDGEGSFDIRPKFCRFQLAVRADERPILDEIVARTGIGGVTVMRKARGLIAPQVQWAVWNKADCLALVALLDRFSLRAKKQRDFVVWRDAVMEWASCVRQPNGWDGLAQPRKQLMALRRYQEVTDVAG